MDEAITSDRTTELLWTWMILSGLAFLALYLFLGLFDNTTEILPNHHAVLNSCAIGAVLSALVVAGLVLSGSRHLSVWLRACLAVLLPFFAFLAVFLLSSRVAGLVEGWIDFPAAQTRTHPALLVIARAYRTHDKGLSWNIQTTPPSSNLQITKADYDFMLRNQPPAGIARHGDEILSHGFFCAKVMVQQTQIALRVLHAGTKTLPQGTVVVCHTGPTPTP